MRRKAHVWVGKRSRWDHVDKNKRGTLYRARVKFDRCIMYDGSAESKKAIIDLTQGGVSFDGDILVKEDVWEYPVNTMVCISLTGDIDCWHPETFDNLFEEWPEAEQRKTSNIQHPTSDGRH